MGDGGWGDGGLGDGGGGGGGEGGGAAFKPHLRAPACHLPPLSLGLNWLCLRSSSRFSGQMPKTIRLSLTDSLSL